MQMKTTLRFHLTPFRLAIFKGKSNNKRWWEYGETGTLIHCWWECKLVQPLWKAIWTLLKKLRIELPYDLVIPPLRIYPCKSEYNRHLYTNVHSSTVHSS
jgi:hypothetical protein